MQRVLRTAGARAGSDREDDFQLRAPDSNADRAVQAQLARSEDPKMKMARELLENFLGDVRGQAAVDKIMGYIDKNSSGDISVGEFKTFLKQQDVGNFATRGIVASKAIEYMTGGASDVLTPADIARFLDVVGLGSAVG